jgi:feruloyl esterase
MMYLQWLVPIFGASVTAVAYSAPSFEEKCISLASHIDLDLPFTVNIARYLPPTAPIDHEAEGLNATCLEYAGGVAYRIAVGFCRMNLRVETSHSSEVYVEVWLPEHWQGRLLTTGNGGLAGCTFFDSYVLEKLANLVLVGIQYADLAYGTEHGFATVGTNAGHNGTSGGAFNQHPEVVEDFSWRAVYTGARVGRSILRQFYGEDCGKSYYLGCSTGGRQGFKAIQKNPELFDGVVAGAPAIDQFGVAAWLGFANDILGYNANGPPLISPEQWAAVQEEALNQCDALDGATDGILEDPAACSFDWTPLECPDNSNSSSTCLTPAQTQVAAQLFAPLTYNSSVLHPGHFHGYETALFSTLGAGVRTWLSELFRYVVYSDPTWDPSTFSLKDAYNAVILNPSNLNTLDGDISAFRDRGGKVLHWHGGADPVLAPAVSNKYYAKVQASLNASVAELDTFYRYFHASGVNHCAGGSGASFLGQMHVTDTNSGDPDDNVLLRIVEWVEKGAPPEFIRGTKFVDDNVELGVEFTRKHCKYPLVNTYTGAGNGTDEEGWSCVEAST